jgi:secreted trypsin-like serine protease
MLRTHSIVVCSFVLSISASAIASGPVDAPVVGGTAVPPGAWPDAVVVLAPHAACTGTLIAADVVLTAGHCVDAQPVTVVVDTVDFGHPGGYAVPVKWSRAYPDWQHRYDVGVVVLEHGVFAKPRAIASACTIKDELAPGVPVKVVGFGLTTASGTGTNTRLHEAVLHVIDPMCTSDAACEPAVAPGGELTAGGRGTDACFGDSGGPLYLNTPSGAALLGVVSRGEATAVPCGGDGVYVRADKVVAWIERVTARKLTRTPCDGPADDGGDGVDVGGCSVGGGLGASVMLVIAALWILTLPRRR